MEVNKIDEKMTLQGSIELINNMLIVNHDHLKSFCPKKIFNWIIADEYKELKALMDSRYNTFFKNDEGVRRCQINYQ